MQQWYVVQTKPRKESVAVDNLERQGYTAYCPKMEQTKHRRQRWEKVIEPLFPRYLFVQLDIGEDDFGPIRSTIGVVSMVRFGGQPAIIPDEVIESIQNQEKSLISRSESYPSWKPGDKIEIIEGPFVGLNGIFEKENDEDRILILLEMLGRKNRVTVNANNIVLV